MVFPQKGSISTGLTRKIPAGMPISFETGKTNNLTRSLPASFTEEIHDAPTPPSPYGIAGWTEQDEQLLIYDRYDIWSVDPTGKNAPVNLTNARAEKESVPLSQTRSPGALDRSQAEDFVAHLR